MAVTAVGDKTFIGGVARGVQEEKGDSPLKKRLTAFAAAIANAGYIGAALVAAAYLFNAVVMDNDYNPARIALFLQSPANVIRLLTHSASLAVGVIVMAVPEGLPMMITVVLSANTRRMRKDNVLVRKLVGLETAGSMNILFTDKTGTLTVGRPKVARVISGIGDIINLSRKSALREYLRAALFFNNGASVSSGKPAGGNGTDRALLEFALKLPPSAENIRAKSKTPFDSRLKYRAAVVEGGINGAFITGAPEKILPLCGDCFTETEARAGVNRARLEAALSAAQDEAARLVAVAYSAEPVLRPGPSARFTLIAVCAVRDEARKEAPQGVNLLKRAGIQVVMITGDSKQTAAAIAKQTGIYRGGDELILTSGDMGGLNDDQLTAVLPRLRVVARALPSDKTRLVRIARNAGLVAGMTGDGVNDAPSLRKADVGFAMGSGADVAKEAADIVIMDDNLLSITKAVQYGRTIFKSIRKFIIFQMTINICAMAVSVIAPLLRVDAPVTILQMLWMNMVMDTLAGLAFAGEQTLRRYMSEKPKQLSEPILNRYMKLEIALGAAFMLALCLVFLKSPSIAAFFPGDGSLPLMTAFFGLFMFSGIFGSACARTHKLNLFDHLAGNKMFTLIMCGVTAAQVAILYGGGAAFRVTPLSGRQFALVAALAFLTVPAHLIRKVIYKSTGVKMGT
jgi:calcium-translocating P-type ATPase